MQAGGVEPVDPFQRGQLDIGERLPRPFATDLLGLKQADCRFGEGVVVGIADAADRGVDTSVDQALREAKASILTAGIGVMYEPGDDWNARSVASPERHLQRVEHEV